MPFTATRARPTPALLQSDNYDGHVPGRDLYALHTAEAVCSVQQNEAAIAKYRRPAFFRIASRRRCRLDVPQSVRPCATWAVTTYGEGFHALYALTAFRDDSTARKLAERITAAILELWYPKDG